MNSFVGLTFTTTHTVWNKEVFGDVNKEGDGLLKRIRELDTRDDDFDLNVLEWEEIKSLLVELNNQD